MAQVLQSPVTALFGEPKGERAKPGRPKKT
jgi:hypothetical protein